MAAAETSHEDRYRRAMLKVGNKYDWKPAPPSWSGNDEANYHAVEQTYLELYEIRLVITSALLGADYRTGTIRWRRTNGGDLSSASILTTAGQLFITVDTYRGLLALNLPDGHVLWHTRPGGVCGCRRSDDISNRRNSIHCDGSRWCDVHVKFSWKLVTQRCIQYPSCCYWIIMGLISIKLW